MRSRQDSKPQDNMWWRAPDEETIESGIEFQIPELSIQVSSSTRHSWTTLDSTDMMVGGFEFESRNAHHQDMSVEKSSMTTGCSTRDSRDSLVPWTRLQAKESSHECNRLWMRGVIQEVKVTATTRRGKHEFLAVTKTFLNPRLRRDTSHRIREPSP